MRSRLDAVTSMPVPSARRYAASVQVEEGRGVLPQGCRSVAGRERFRLLVDELGDAHDDNGPTSPG